MQEREVTLAAGVDAPGEARAALRDVLEVDGVSPGSVEVAILLLSELVSNAVEHGRPPLSVRFVADGDVYVAVSDGDSRHPRVEPPERRRVRGWGVALVDALADSWGVEPNGSGKTVFFRVRRDLR